MAILRNIGRQAEVIGPHTEGLLLRHTKVTEKLGRTFEIELEVLSLESDLEFEDYITKDMAVRLQLPHGGRRYFHGFVTSFTYECQIRLSDEDYTLYRIILRPWLWFLTQGKDCRIFQNMKVPDIIKEVFRNAGFVDFEERLVDEYREREYCVQYRESHHDFVCRLMEKEGIYFYFRHEAGKHTLVLSDSVSAHEPVPGYEQVPFRTSTTEGAAEEEVILTWSVAQEFKSDSFSIADFDFQTPRVDLIAQASDPDARSDLHFEIFDYHGTHHTPQEGERYARTSMEEIAAERERAKGESTARGLGSGHLFRLRAHPRRDQNRNYLIVNAEHEIRVNAYFTDTEEAEEEPPLYQAKLEAMDAKYTFRPKKDTKKPVVKGPQTAIVVGPDGEEIYADDFGRVKVHFHWDRHNEASETSSCWIRVAQRWAGGNWGGLVTPRIGMEVVVDFLEGDPDEPLITGLVYNDDNRPPYDPSEHGTMSTFKSESSKGGGGFNEFRFEDKKGDEQIFMHGEKDQDVRIEHDSREWIGNDRHLIVENDQKEKVGGSKHSKVDGDRSTAVDGDEDLKVGGGRTTQVGGGDNLAVGGEFRLKVSGDISFKGAAKWATKCESDIAMHSAGGMVIKADSGIQIQTGSDVYLKSGRRLVIEAPEKIALLCGGNQIVLHAGGVDIQGTMVKINSGVDATTVREWSPHSPASPGSPDAPAAPTEAAEAEPGSTPQAPEDPEPPDATEGPTASGHTDTATQAAREGDPLTQPAETPAERSEAGDRTGDPRSTQEPESDGLRREGGESGRNHY